MSKMKESEVYPEHGNTISDFDVCYFGGSSIRTDHFYEMLQTLKLLPHYSESKIIVFYRIE